MRRFAIAALAATCCLALLSPSQPTTPSPRARPLAEPIPDASDMRAILSSARSGPTPALEAEVTDHVALITEKSYPVLDAQGQPAGEQKWRIVGGTGNCCENYVASNSRGRLFDFGGDYLYYSDDEGRTWKRVEPADPLPNFGEGAVAVAPNGDIVGVAWNPYHGDRVVPFKYEAEEETWYYTTTKLHQPFFDRQSLAALPGPFTFAGEEYPYIVLLKGGWPAKDPWFVSLDGLNYFVPSAKFLEQLTEDPVTGYLDFKGTPEHDWLQATYQTRLTALGKGQALSGLSGYAEDEVSLKWGLLRKNIKWSAFEFKGTSLPGNGNMLTDSQGRLHYVDATQKATIYMMSEDGGRTWITEKIPVPKGSKGRPDVDFRANGKLQLTAIAAHIHDKDDKSQDYVYKLSTEGGRIRLLKTYLVGDGQLVTGSGVASSAPRFDFSTITFFPDGRVALSFIDGEHRTPHLAIEQ